MIKIGVLKIRNRKQTIIFGIEDIHRKSLVIILKI